MTLHNYIRKRLHDDVAFVESQPNNFVPDDILPDVVIFTWCSDILPDADAHSRSHENCSPCRMDFVRDRITNSLMEQ